MAAPLTEAAIEQVRMLITSGQLVPGQRLPPEAELAESLGTGRSTVREAVRALVAARVLDVRRGDGTFVTSLRPELLLAGIGAAADLLEQGFTLELVQVRRILEPAATAMAATRITDETLSQLDVCLHQMSKAPSHEELVQFDEEFHHLVATASGNATLASMLNGVSSRTTRGTGLARRDRSRRNRADHLRARRNLGGSTRSRPTTLRKLPPCSTCPRPRPGSAPSSTPKNPKQSSPSPRSPSRPWLHGRCS